MRFWSRPLRRRRDDRPPAPFVVGVARSGTTLLRLMLDAHPELAIPPETHFVPKFAKALERLHGDRHEGAIELLTSYRRWPDFELEADDLRARLEPIRPLTATDALRAFYAAYAEKQGKGRWGDKSPSYVRKMRRVQMLLPEARFIHLIRDGRDVALSQVAVHFGPDDVDEAARKWTEEITKARRDARRLSGYLELRYEDLVADPEPVLRRIASFVELPWSEAMLEYHERARERMAPIERDFGRGHEPDVPAATRARQHERVGSPPQGNRAGRWRSEMADVERASFEAIAGDLLAELGYEVGRPTAGAAA